MGIIMHFVASLQSFVDNQEILDVNGWTIGECINTAIHEFPALKNKLLSRNGRLRKQIGIYINGKNAAPDELKVSTKDGDNVYILEIYTGG
jgi:molybdopterin converting factor small subunit